MNAVLGVFGRPSAMALGWALVHSLWQGALIAALLWFINLFLRRSGAMVRYVTASMAMVLMLAASVMTFVSIELAPAGSTTKSPGAASSMLYPTAGWPIGSSNSTGASTLATQSRIWLTDSLPWLVCLWSAGVLLLSVRSFGGWIIARRLRTTGCDPPDSAWLQMVERLARRLRVRRPVTLCQSALVKEPGVIGWWRPVILVPASVLAGLTPEMLEAVLAHELAHVRRCDYLVNILQTVVETLLFYHPAVWWVGNKIREERENCCDDLAVAACGNALTYARALTELEHSRGAHTQLVMASTGGSLMGRIRRLVGGGQPAGWRFSAPAAGSIVVLALFAAWGLTPVSVPNHTYQSPAGNPGRRPARIVQIAQAVSSPSSPQVSPSAQSAAPEGFIGGLAAAGYKNLSADDLIQFKIHGVTPEFVRQVQASGLGHPDPDQLVAMRIHDVTPEFINEMKAAGFSGLSVDDLVSFKIHGVNPARVKELQALWGKITADDLVSAQIHGVTPEYARQIKSMGLGDPSFDDAVAMKIHGVTPEFVNSMKALGIKELNIDQLTAFKIHGVDPAAVEELQKLGFTSLSADDVVSMQIHGVTPEFVRAIREAGITRFSADDAVAARIHGVTPAFVREVRKHGFNNLGIDQIIELKRLNILSEKDTN